MGDSKNVISNIELFTFPEGKTNRFYNTMLFCLPLCVAADFTNLSPPPSSYLARTTPGDVARVEKQTYVCTEKKEDAVPTAKEGAKSKLGNWKSPAEMDKELDTKFPGCMKGRGIWLHTGQCAYIHTCLR